MNSNSPLSSTAPSFWNNVPQKRSLSATIWLSIATAAAVMGATTASAAAYASEEAQPKMVLKMSPSLWGAPLQKSWKPPIRLPEGIVNSFLSKRVKGVPFCLETVRSWINSLTGISLQAKGDVADIIEQGVSKYALAIQDTLAQSGISGAYLGYSEGFWKGHFNAPIGANIGIYFADTRQIKNSWGKKRKVTGGHAAAIILYEWKWVVLDPYYLKRAQAPYMLLHEYTNLAISPLAQRLAGQESKLLGAVFFKGGDLSSIARLSQYISHASNTPVVE